jgi:hypothetical protein
MVWTMLVWGCTEVCANFFVLPALVLGDELDLFYYVIDEVEDDLWIRA